MLRERDEDGDVRHASELVEYVDALAVRKPCRSASA